MTTTMDEFARLLVEISEVVNGEKFQAAIDEFCVQHDSMFSSGYKKEVGEGYSLEQTEVHKKYEALVDKLLTEQLRSGFPMEKVTSGLEAYMKTVREKKDENPEMEKAVAAMDVLMSFTDFVAFHDMMVGHRFKKEEPAGGDVGRRLTSTVDTGMVKIQEFLDMTSTLCAEGATKDDWYTVSSTSDFVVLTKSFEGKKLLKCNIAMEGDMDMAVDLYMNFTEERSNWDTSMSNLQVIKNLMDDDKKAAGILQDEIVELTMVMPAAVKWMMGFPDRLTFRVATQLNPDGVYSYVTATWDVEKDVPLLGKLEIKKVGTIKKIDDNKLMVSALQDMSSWVPDWMLGAMMKTFVRGKMNAMVDAHKKYRQEHPLKK